MKTINVTIEASGEVKIDAVGFKGDACTKATAAIEKALGVATKGGKKPEFYQGQQQSQKAGQ